MSDQTRESVERARAERVRQLGRLLRERLGTAPPTASGRVLEIGCGHGHFLSAFAAAHPGDFCVGVDLLSKRLERARRKRDRAGLANLDFLKADALEALEAWPAEARLSLVFLLYPDPWPKTRHHKNRIVGAPLLDRLAALTAAGALLCFRTDHEDYHRWALAKIAAHPAWQILDGAPWPFEHETIFSQRTGARRDIMAARR